VPSHASTRRNFLHVTAISGTGLLVAGVSGAAGAADPDAKNAQPDKDKPNAAEEVSPPEDLMREHGVLKRVMLVYEEIVRRIDANQDFPPEALADAAQIIRSFVEDYHEKLEENYLFPRFQKANKLVDLVAVLKTQHEAGRKVTDVILQRASASALKDSDNRARVTTAIRAFNRMYAPHEAREDTELFPAFHGIVSANEYDALGEDFEKKENELFGQDGFEKMVDRVAGIEKQLGIYDLAQFTPRV
jgi:hemerythrin-like domain-containing protein